MHREGTFGGAAKQNHPSHTLIQSDCSPVDSSHTSAPSFLLSFQGRHVPTNVVVSPWVQQETSWLAALWHPLQWSSGDEHIIPIYLLVPVILTRPLM